jgi:hypothetical protein
MLTPRLLRLCNARARGTFLGAVSALSCRVVSADVAQYFDVSLPAAPRYNRVGDMGCH